MSNSILVLGPKIAETYQLAINQSMKIRTIKSSSLIVAALGLVALTGLSVFLKDQVIINDFKKQLTNIKLLNSADPIEAKLLLKGLLIKNIFGK
ncbi:hypothetical protein AB751O23_AH_00040 [Chlamydiales bacterium SCGC AB-751-O23]|jgi:hypothetical protein|nr:hypothetical protein AB751O23_AH_00040 [Chlamydiales bacterium SCGC AB-751-O23]